MKSATLSIIILNYNTRDFALEAIKSIEKNYPAQTRSGEYELIIADNASPDGSLSAFQEYQKKSLIKSFIIVDNKKNLGFSRGNNNAIRRASGSNILILNPDTYIPPKTLLVLLNFLSSHPDTGAVTCKILYPDCSLDPNCLRGFPTPWNSFCHFSGISKIFPRIPFLSGYLQSGWRNINKIQKVDAIEGAFMLIPKKIGEEIGWFDEDYFFYGEDLQLCFGIHKSGYKIYYIPDVSITHYGGVSSGIKKQTEKITTAGIELKKNIQKHRFDAMRLFFQKNYSNQYNPLFSRLVFFCINLLYKRQTKNKRSDIYSDKSKTVV